MTELVYSAQELDYEKIACIDLNGTLIQGNEMGPTAHEINTALGLEKEIDDKIYRSNKNGRGALENYIKHAAQITRHLRGFEEANVSNYAEACYELIMDREIIEGADEFVSTLENNGYHTVLTSSAPKAITRNFAEELEASSVYVFRDWLFDEEGEFESLYVDPESDQGKQEFVKALQSNGSTVFYAGNGGNDIKAAKVADKGVRRWDWMGNPEEAFQEAKKEAKL